MWSGVTMESEVDVKCIFNHYFFLFFLIIIIIFLFLFYFIYLCFFFFNLFIFLKVIRVLSGVIAG